MLRKNSKSTKALRVFVQRGARGLNRFEAVTLARDYVLPQTVFALERRCGLQFSRTSETVGEFSTRCLRYSLTVSERQKAIALLKART
jgi:hypothetical protein